MASSSDTPRRQQFALRYYVGHKGKFGHEFLLIEIFPEGLLRYANNSGYKKDGMIQKEVILNQSVMQEMQRIVNESGILDENDKRWPTPDRIGKQELEITCNGQTVEFETSKIGSSLDVSNSSDPSGLLKFYYLVQDIKCFVYSLIRMHFKIKPI